MGANGWRADQIFTGTDARSFDDVVLIPGLTTLQDDDIPDVRTSLTHAMTLQVPVVSIGSVDADAAIALACAGGLGIIHAEQSLESEAAAVKRVRAFMSNFILEPATLSSADTVATFEQLQKESGRTGVCITDTGALGGKLLGIMTASDAENAQDKTQFLSKVMTTEVLVGQEPITLHEAQQLMCKGKVGKLPIVNSSMELVSMLSRQDHKKGLEFPNASRDDNGQLLVGAAVIPGERNPKNSDDLGRARTLVEAGAMLLFVDISKTEKDYHLDLLRELKQEFPSIELIAGPVGSCRQAKRCCEAGADILLVGSSMMDGSMPDATVTYEVAKYARVNYGASSIAAGSHLNPMQALKALSLGAAAISISPESSTSSTQRASRLQQSAEQVSEQAKLGMRELGTKNLPKLHAGLLDGEIKLELCSPFAAHLRAQAEAGIVA